MREIGRQRKLPHLHRRTFSLGRRRRFFAERSKAMLSCAMAWPEGISIWGLSPTAAEQCYLKMRGRHGNLNHEKRLPNDAIQFASNPTEGVRYSFGGFTHEPSTPLIQATILSRSLSEPERQQFTSAMIY